MSNNIVSNVKINFKLISFFLFFFSALFCNNLFCVFLLFSIIFFILWRTKINAFKYFLFFLMISLIYIVLKLAFGVNIMFLYKIYFIYMYLFFISKANNDYEVINGLKKYFKDNFVKFIYKVKLFFDSFIKYFKINYNLYGKYKFINSIYLSFKKNRSYYDFVASSNSDRKYKILGRKSLLYDFLFVFMHISVFIFCALSGVYL